MIKKKTFSNSQHRFPEMFSTIKSIIGHSEREDLGTDKPGAWRKAILKFLLPQVFLHLM